MRPRVARLAGLLCLTLLTALLPTATTPVALLAPVSSSAAHHLPAGLVWGRGATGLGDLPLGWTTYLGGKSADKANAVAVDRQGNVYVTGDTQSADFPVTPAAAQPRYGGGGTDAFVAAYDTSGRLRWATYLGGSDFDEGTGIATDGQGNVYVTGITYSPDFLVTPGAAQPRYGGGYGDAFMAAYDTNGRLRWATYLGGSGDEQGTSITADGLGTVYLTGITGSRNFPVTSGGVRPYLVGAGYSDAFMAAFDESGRLRWATYLDWSSYDHRAVTATDGRGNIYLTGQTTSPDFSVTPGAAQSISGGGADAFVARLVLPSSYPPAFDPASPLPPGTPHARYFPVTRHTLRDPYLTFWDRLGGIPTMGLSLSEPFILAGQQIQVTERAVLVRSGSQVQLFPLGRLLSAARPFAPLPPVPSPTPRLYFSSTGHTLSGPFLAYWQEHQGSLLLGAPIGEPEQEGLGDGTGRSYLVQWFSNGRLELHPEAKDPRYRVEQGRVGYEYLHRLGLL